MSVTNVNSNSPTVPSLRSAEQASTDPDKQKLRKACHDMEGYFVSMLLKKMHESAMKGGLFEEKSEGATYRDMFDDAVATQIGKKGAFGIADMLYRELSKQGETAGAEPTPGTQTPTPAGPAKQQPKRPTGENR